MRVVIFQKYLTKWQFTKLLFLVYIQFIGYEQNNDVFVDVVVYIYFSSQKDFQ